MGVGRTKNKLKEQKHMAHRISEFDKQQGLVQAWHGLTEVEPAISLDNNWLRTWELVPVTLEKKGLPTKWTILECTDLGEKLEIGQPYNPDSFQPVNNAAFLEMIKDSIAGTPHVVSSVGSVRNRGRVFVSIELNGMEKFKAAGRDFGSFLNFGNGHDKSSVLWVNTSNICTVCDNTFTSNLISVENKIAKSDDVADDTLNLRQRHTKNVKLRLPELSKVIDMAIGVQAEFKLAMDTLHELVIPMPEATSLFAGFIGRNVAKPLVKNGLSTRSMNTVTRLGDLFVNGKGNRGETLADAFSAVTDFYTHFSSGGDNIHRQVLSSEYGSGNVNKQAFWNMVQMPESRYKAIELGDELLTNTKD